MVLSRIFVTKQAKVELNMEAKFSIMMIINHQPSTAHDYTSNSNDIVIFFDILLHSENWEKKICWLEREDVERLERNAPYVLLISG